MYYVLIPHPEIDFLHKRSGALIWNIKPNKRPPRGGGRFSCRNVHKRSGALIWNRKPNKCPPGALIRKSPAVLLHLRHILYFRIPCSIIIPYHRRHWADFPGLPSESLYRISAAGEDTLRLSGRLTSKLPESSHWHGPTELDQGPRASPFPNTTCPCSTPEQTHKRAMKHRIHTG